MRRLVLALLLIAPASILAQQTVTVEVKPAAPPSIDPAHQATPQQIHEYFELIGLDKTMKKLMSQMFAAMKTASPPYMPDSVWQDMDKTFGSYDLIGALVPIYQKYLTREDLDGTLTFYHTAAGRHLLASQGAMSGESQANFQAIGRRLGEEVAARHADEIIAAQKKYEQGIADKQNLLGTPPPLR